MAVILASGFTQQSVYGTGAVGCAPLTEQSEFPGSAHLVTRHQKIGKAPGHENSALPIIREKV